MDDANRMNWRNTLLTKLLNIQYPIVQGPFGGGMSAIALTTAVSNLGGLGSYGCQPSTPDEIIQLSRDIRKITDKPFNLNLWVYDRDERLKTFDHVAYEKLKLLFKPYFDELSVPLPEMPTDLGPKYEDQVQAMLVAKPPVFSFVFGIPSEDILEKCRSNGTKTIGAATTVDEAIALEKAGVDAVVATGFEAGGHRVSFLRDAEDSLTGTFSLIPQVADSVSIPIIAAGGVADARGIKAALTLGAHAVQIGTAFLATKQSNITDAHRQGLFSPEAKYTTLTKLFSGRLARGIRSKLTRELKGQDHLLAPYPIQSKFLTTLRTSLIKNDKAEYITFWSGQSAPLIKHRDVTALFNYLVEETNKLYS
jgi:nitronate monooxygenase